MQTIGETPSAPLSLPADTRGTTIARRARIAHAARMARALRRMAILALLLSILLGSGIYVARPLLPDWIASAKFMKWLDRWIERLPHSVDILHEHSSLDVDEKAHVEPQPIQLRNCSPAA